MNKGELIETVKEKTGLTKKDVKKIIDATTDVITDSLVNGEKVSLVGFGTFQTSHRKERIGKNPQTGEKIKISARDVPRFVAGKSLKDQVK